MRKSIFVICAFSITAIAMISCTNDNPGIFDVCKDPNLELQADGTCIPKETNHQQNDCSKDATMCSGDKRYCVEVPDGAHVCASIQDCGQFSSRKSDGSCSEPEITEAYCASLSKIPGTDDKGNPACVDVDECNNQCTGDKPHCVEVPGGNHVCSATETCGGDQERQEDGACAEIEQDPCNNQCTGDKPHCVEVPSGNHVCSATEKCSNVQERQEDGACAETEQDPCNNQCSGDKPHCVEVPSGNHVCSATEKCSNVQERQEDGACAEIEQDPCDNQCTDEKPYCVEVPNGSYVCSSVQECIADLIRDNDGYCVSEVYKVSCQSHYDCEPNYLCGIDNTCVPETEAGNVYRYVRIDDLSTASARSQDPGADIDAIALRRPSTGDVYFAHYIRAYNVSGDSFVNEGNVANNPAKAIGAPDAFSTYMFGQLANDNCIYKDASDDFTFVSLGGNGGYIEVEMSSAIQNNDVLEILELGGCKLENAGDATDRIATRDSIKVSILADGNSWIAGATFDRSGNGSDGDNGLLSWPVTGL